MRYFELGEFVHSDIALRKGMDNTPSFSQVHHLEDLITRILDPLREAWGSPLRITSGYRCPELNRAVGGSKTSAHLTGYAADVQPTDTRRTAKFILFANAWLMQYGIAFDQAIDESSGSSRWWHISLQGSDGRQRCQFLSLEK